MIANWFKSCITNGKINLDAVKAQYRKLARKFHPDMNRGASEAELQANHLKMCEVNNEYEALCKQYERGEKVNHKTGETYTQSEAAAEAKDHVNSYIAQILWELAHLPEEVEIEVNGYWIRVWTNGHKEFAPIFKKLGLTFGFKARYEGSKQEGVWTYAGTRARMSGCSMEQIRGWYGSQSVKHNRVESDEGLLQEA